jgi:uncharacterized glyoxalase superfamily protein PhnB
MEITSLLFWVQENTLSTKFYKKIGFDVVRSADDHSVVTLNSFEITLVNMRDEDKFAKDSMSGDKGRGVYMYIKVDDVDAKYKELENQGFKPTTKPKDWEWGNREFILKDPDGYKLCFWQPIKQG